MAKRIVSRGQSKAVRPEEYDTHALPTKDNFMGQFFTHPDTVEFCIQELQRRLPQKIQRYLFIEPSAGQGAFVEGLRSHKCKTIAVEADPVLAKEHSDLIDIYAPLQTQGFLGVPKSQLYDTKRVHSKQVVCIGNPPFSNPRAEGNNRGHFSNLALTFINHIASEQIADTIAFVLPASFRRPLLQKKVHKNLQVIADLDLNSNVPFLQNSASGLKPIKKNCVLLIWKVKRDPKTGQVQNRVDRDENQFSWEKSRKGVWINKRTGQDGPFQFVNNIDPRAQLAIYKWATLKKLGHVLSPSETKQKIQENIQGYQSKLASSANGKNPPVAGGTVYYLYCPNPSDVRKVYAQFQNVKPEFEKLGLDRSHNFSAIDITRDDCINLFLQDK